MSQEERFAALSDPTRQVILDLLHEAGGTLPFQEVSTHLAARTERDYSQGLISAHLAVLREAGLIQMERPGRSTVYHLAPDALRAVKEQVETWL